MRSLAIATVTLGAGCCDEPPETVRDLTAEALGPGSVRLTWTAPTAHKCSEVGLLDTDPEQYDVRFGTAPPTHHNWYDMPTAGRLVASEQGTLEEYVLGDLDSGTTYYFALRVAGDPFDEFISWSAPSNVATATTWSAPE